MKAGHVRFASVVQPKRIIVILDPQSYMHRANGQRKYG
jgi:hypothetical protein